VWRGALNGLLALTLVYVALNASGLLLLRTALKDSGDASLASTMLAPRTICGILFYGLSFLTFLWALRHHALTVVFPVFSGSAYGVVVVSGWLFLGEAFSLVQLGGVLAIGCGLVLVQLR
jgi:multidrug transporter EmrE-like cation transporter